MGVGDDQPPNYYVSQSKDYVSVGDVAPVPHEVYGQPSQQAAQPVGVYPQPVPQAGATLAQCQPQPQPQPIYVQQAAPAPVNYAPPPVNYVYLSPGQAPPPGAQVVYMAQPPAVMQPYQPTPVAPNVVYLNNNNVKPRGSHYSICVAAMTLFIVTYAAGVYPCGIISIAFSLHAANVRAIIDKHRGAVIACSILELLSWCFMGAFSWYFTCYYTYQSVPIYNYYGEITGYENEDALYCQWWGWIAIIVWYVFGMAFGIPRVVFTMKSRYNVAPGCSPSTMIAQPVAYPTVTLAQPTVVMANPVVVA